MTQVSGVHCLTVAHVCAKKNKKYPCSPIFNHKLRKIELEKLEKVKNIKVALEPQGRNGI
jgi:hypothetical protein